MRLYRLLQIGLTVDEAENGPAVRNDWLLAIHSARLAAENAAQPATTKSANGVVTRSLGPPGG